MHADRRRGRRRKEQEAALGAGGPMGDIVDDTTPVGTATGCAPLMFGRVQVDGWGDPGLNGTEAAWHAEASHALLDAAPNLIRILIQGQQSLPDADPYPASFGQNRPPRLIHSSHGIKTRHSFKKGSGSNQLKSNI